jgi:hypothetical protein
MTCQLGKDLLKTSGLKEGVTGVMERNHQEKGAIMKSETNCRCHRSTLEEKEEGNVTYALVLGNN